MLSFVNLTKPGNTLPMLERITKALCFSLSLAFLLFPCCTSSPPLLAEKAFYFWHTTLDLDTASIDYLRALNGRRLYVKVADIGVDAGSGEVIPYARLQVLDSTVLNGLSCTPVVFITNEVFLRDDPGQAQHLAEKTAVLMRSILPAGCCTGEWQIDCDWTPRSRAAFFDYLKALRNYMKPGERLSATIRLHQFKSPQQTGIPPVDRGMLMCYNTGDIDLPETANSILDLEDARKYLTGAVGRYPLPLDVALPVFSWVLIYRNGDLWKIIPGEHGELPSGTLKEGTFVDGHYLRPGDLIRRETISADLLQEVARLLPSGSLAPDAVLAFFSLEEDTPKDYPVPLLQAVCHTLDSLRATR